MAREIFRFLIGRSDRPFSCSRSFPLELGGSSSRFGLPFFFFFFSSCPSVFRRKERLNRLKMVPLSSSLTCGILVPIRTTLFLFYRFFSFPFSIPLVLQNIPLHCPPPPGPNPFSFPFKSPPNPQPSRCPFRVSSFHNFPPPPPPR